ncbi:hotdog domain-containing protein [Candidatus Poriferisodalis sp.]|uniref:hotdog domain-containing protein n=1 Tax=Candidatus Poriferisodalis sp. TaxID=3101277 RepID=UPI003B5CE6DE
MNDPSPRRDADLEAAGDLHLIYPDTQLAERSAAAGALRRLAHAFVRHRTDPETLAEIAAWAEATAGRLEAGSAPVPRPADYFARRYTDPRPADGAEVTAFSDRAFSGPANPTAMEVDMRRDGDGVRALVTFGAAFESAPGRAHGGSVCAVVDDVLGYLMVCLGIAAYTARLEIDYRGGVPIDEPVIFAGRETRREGRKSHVELAVRAASAAPDAPPLIEANGLFVIVTADQLAKDG